jgi:hypothetical protein
MHPRSISFALSITFVLAVGMTDRARAQCPSCAASAKTNTAAGSGTGWTYYGLEGGGPYVTYPPEASAKKHNQAVAVYGPISATETVGTGKLWNPPRSRLIGYTWFGYRGPSARPKPESVSVYSSP